MAKSRLRSAICSLVRIDRTCFGRSGKMQDTWLQLPEGRKLGAAIKVQVDHSDGESIWVFDRCSSNSCANSTIPPIQKFDSNGKFVRAFGANMFIQLHGLYVDYDGNVWAADNGVRNGCFRKMLPPTWTWFGGGLCRVGPGNFTPSLSQIRT